MHILEVKELVRDYSIISEDKKERTQIHVLKGLDFPWRQENSSESWVNPAVARRRS